MSPPSGEAIRSVNKVGSIFNIQQLLINLTEHATHSCKIRMNNCESVHLWSPLGGESTREAGGTSRPETHNFLSVLLCSFSADQTKEQTVSQNASPCSSFFSQLGQVSKNLPHGVDPERVPPGSGQQRQHDDELLWRFPRCCLQLLHLTQHVRF